jgi:hypothetical protein
MLREITFWFSNQIDLTQAVYSLDYYLPYYSFVYQDLHHINKVSRWSVLCFDGDVLGLYVPNTLLLFECILFPLFCG